MTMGISRIFRSTDVGAPVFTNNVVGSLTALLKAVLVNGYGSTASLGWTLEFDGTGISAFRMKGGTRTFIRFDDSSYNSVGHTEVSAFSTMSSLNNGTERIPNIGVNAFIHKSQVTPGVAPWIIIGDDAGFWILFNNLTGSPTTANRYSAMYLGDYNAWDVKNKWNFCMIASNATNPPTMATRTYDLRIHTPATTSTGYQHIVARGSSFARGCVYVGILPFNQNTVLGQNMLVVNIWLSSVKLGGALFGSAIHLYETVSNGSLILGSLPGVLEPIGMDSNAESATLANTAHVETVDSDGDKSIFIYISPHTETVLSTMDKAIFKVGKGFRNAQ